jgi:hypothetical protein
MREGKKMNEGRGRGWEEENEKRNFFFFVIFVNDDYFFFFFFCCRCFNQLELPEYGNKNELNERLRKAIDYGGKFFEM